MNRSQIKKSSANNWHNYRRIWTGVRPEKGNVVIFHLVDGCRVVGIYQGKTDKNYILRKGDCLQMRDQDNKLISKKMYAEYKYYVYEGRIESATVLDQKKYRGKWKG